MAKLEMVLGLFRRKRKIDPQVVKLKTQVDLAMSALDYIKKHNECANNAKRLNVEMGKIEEMPVDAMVALMDEVIAVSIESIRLETERKKVLKMMKKEMSE